MATKISILQPKTKIREHNGPSNTRLRLHLGIEVPDGASITVGGIKKTWEEGKLLAFDDSFVHSVEHNGDAPRIAYHAFPATMLLKLAEVLSQSMGFG